MLTLAATAETLILVPLCGLGGALGGGWQAWFTIFAVLTVSGCVGSSIVSFFAVILPSQAFAIVYDDALMLDPFPPLSSTPSCNPSITHHHAHRAPLACSK